jgi:hypothetical protein
MFLGSKRISDLVDGLPSQLITISFALGCDAASDLHR